MTATTTSTAKKSHLTIENMTLNAPPPVLLRRVERVLERVLGV